MRRVMLPSLAAIGQEQSSIPLRGNAGMPAPHNRMQARIDQGNDRLGFNPSCVIDKDLHFAAGIERPAIEGHDVTGVVPAPPRQRKRLARQPSRALIGPVGTVGEKRAENRGGARAGRAGQADETFGKVPCGKIRRVIDDASTRGRRWDRRTELRLSGDGR